MPQEQKVRQLVRKIVYRTLGISDSGSRRSRPIVSELDIRDLPPGSTFEVPPGAILTPLARQVAMDRSIKLTEGSPAASPTAAKMTGPSPARPSQQGEPIAIGADHGGYAMKQMLIDVLESAGYTVIDCGTDSTDSVDYPDFALAVAQLVSQGKAARGVIIDGAGIGSCMAANKVPGVRAAMCYDQATAHNSREHNNANVLTLGAGLLGDNLARQILETWLKIDFAGGRHARRVDKITEIEKRYLK
ncbi:MAG: ribose 5-phosphate isomerase B [Anaerolineales bacterium]|nr:ribose 5-phosphate isomerase B [Anaerolineales bacterium]